MSERPHVYISRSWGAEDYAARFGESQVPRITMEIRIYAPYRTSKAHLCELFEQAVQEAQVGILEKENWL